MPGEKRNLSRSSLPPSLPSPARSRSGMRRREKEEEECVAHRTDGYLVPRSCLRASVRTERAREAVLHYYSQRAEANNEFN